MSVLLVTVVVRIQPSPVWGRGGSPGHATQPHPTLSLPPPLYPLVRSFSSMAGMWGSGGINGCGVRRALGAAETVYCFPRYTSVTLVINWLHCTVQRLKYSSYLGNYWLLPYLGNYWLLPASVDIGHAPR